MASSTVDPLGMSLDDIIELNKHQNRQGAGSVVSAKSGNGSWRQRRSRSRSRNGLRNRERSISRSQSRNRGRSVSRSQSASRSNRSFSRSRSVSRNNQNRGRSRSRGNQNRGRSRSRGNQNRNRSASRQRSLSRGNQLRGQSVSPQRNFRRRSASRNSQNSFQSTIYVSRKSPFWNKRGNISYNYDKNGQRFIAKFARSRVQLAKKRLGLAPMVRNKGRNLSYRTGLQTEPILNNIFRSDYMSPRKLRQYWKKGPAKTTAFSGDGAYGGLTVQIVNDQAKSMKRTGGQGRGRRYSNQQNLAQRAGNKSATGHVVEMFPSGSVVTTFMRENGGGLFQNRTKRSVSDDTEDYTSQWNLKNKLNPRIQAQIAEIQFKATTDSTHFTNAVASTSSSIVTPTPSSTGILLSDRFSAL